MVKNDIDLTKEDDFGRTNLERMKQGLAPLDKDGNPIELHHVGQKMDSPLAELTRIGKPAILVPYPYAAANHQVLNAETVVHAGAAKMINDSELQQNLLSSIRELLFNDGALNEMQEQSRKLGKPNAGKEIAKKILSLSIL